MDFGDDVLTCESQYSWLSNFHPCSVKYEGLIYPSVECAFQAAKSLDIKTREAFVWKTSVGAKKDGKKLELREDWERIKIAVMRDCLREKFKIPRLRKLLLETGNRRIRHLNTHHDTFWGCVIYNGVLVGSDELGKLLMQIREEIRND